MNRQPDSGPSDLRGHTFVSKRGGSVNKSPRTFVNKKGGGVNKSVGGVLWSQTPYRRACFDV